MSRENMPVCAAWIDELRDVFGVEEINSCIKRGLRPDCKPEHRVYFSEGGHTLGQRAPEGNGVTLDQMVLESTRVVVVTGTRGRS